MLDLSDWEGLRSGRSVRLQISNAKYSFKNLSNDCVLLSASGWLPVWLLEVFGQQNHCILVDRNAVSGIQKVSQYLDMPNVELSAGFYAWEGNVCKDSPEEYYKAFESAIRQLNRGNFSRARISVPFNPENPGSLLKHYRITKEPLVRLSPYFKQILSIISKYHGIARAKVGVEELYSFKKGDEERMRLLLNIKSQNSFQRLFEDFFVYVAENLLLTEEQLFYRLCKVNEETDLDKKTYNVLSDICGVMGWLGITNPMSLNQNWFLTKDFTLVTTWLHYLEKRAFSPTHCDQQPFRVASEKFQQEIPDYFVN